MINFIKIIVLMTGMFSYGQVFLPGYYSDMLEIDYLALKNRPKEIFYEKINKSAYKGIKGGKYYFFDKKMNIKMRASWEFDSLSNKRILSEKRVVKKTKLKEKMIYDDKKNLVSHIKYLKKGDYAGAIHEKKIFSYSPSNSLQKVITYTSSIDTLNIGYQQLNQGKKIEPEFIDYNLVLISEENYNKKGQLIKHLEFEWIYECKTFKYDLNGNVIEQKTYRIHDLCQNDYLTTNCNNSPNWGESYLHKFDNYGITNHQWNEKINYKYIFDEKGNWIQKQVYDYDYTDSPLMETITREIIYY